MDNAQVVSTASSANSNRKDRERLAFDTAVAGIVTRNFDALRVLPH
jgi:hypothetical protein